MMRPRTSIACVFLALLSLGKAGGASAQDTLAKESPFLPPGTAAGRGGEGSGAAYQLAGGSVTSRGSEVCIYDVGGRRSRWIGVGEADGGFQVVSYDSDADRAVVRIDGVQQTLELRKAASPANAVAFNSFVPAPAYITGPAPRPLSAEAARKQREARMLVADLMDIGMRERQANEEAERRAAEGK